MSLQNQGLTGRIKLTGRDVVAKWSIFCNEMRIVENIGPKMMHIINKIELE